jgi:nitroreductase
MEVFEAVRTVLAVRTYQETRVPDDIVRRIVEAGRLSASAQNLQPWHFIVVSKRATIRAIADILTTGHYATGASHAIAVMILKDKRIAMSDGSRAIQNMILTAWSEGVGSNWIGFGHMPAIEELLGVPDTHQALAVLALGYPAEAIGRGRKKRKPLSEIASSEKFGTPFA